LEQPFKIIYILENLEILRITPPNIVNTSALTRLQKLHELEIIEPVSPSEEITSNDQIALIKNISKSGQLRTLIFKFYTFKANALENIYNLKDSLTSLTLFQCSFDNVQDFKCFDTLHHIQFLNFQLTKLKDYDIFKATMDQLVHLKEIDMTNSCKWEKKLLFFKEKNIRLIKEPRKRKGLVDYSREIIQQPLETIDKVRSFGNKAMLKTAEFLTKKRNEKKRKNEKK